MSVAETKLEQGDLVLGAVCEDCGTVIRYAIAREGGHLLCSKCYDLKPQPKYVFLSPASWSDDMSGASSSWDNTVRILEEVNCN